MTKKRRRQIVSRRGSGCSAEDEIRRVGGAWEEEEKRMERSFIRMAMRKSAKRRW